MSDTDPASSHWWMLYNNRPYLKELILSLENKTRKTQKGDNKTNITNQLNGNTYEIPVYGKPGQYTIYDFFKGLDKVAEVMHFSERQYFEMRDPSGTFIQVTHSCLELDIDKYQNDTAKIGEGTIGQFLNKVAQIIDEVVDLSEIHDYYMVRIGKNDIVKTDKGFKQSFHVRIFLKMSKEVKYYILKRIHEKDILQILGCKPEALDKQSPAYPAMLYNSAKRGSKVAHKLQSMYNAKRVGGDWMCIDQPLENFEYKMLALEFSLNYENPTGFIKKVVVEHKLNLDLTIKTHARVYETEDLDFATKINKEVESLCRDNPDAELVRDLLNILNPERCRKFEDWKKWIGIISRLNPEYKPLFIQFSMNCPGWDDSSVGHINGIWSASSKGHDKFSAPASLRLLRSAAEDDDPEMYRVINNKSVNTILHNLIVKNCGNLNETDIATVLKCIVGRQFIADTESTISTKTLQTRTWFQFVLPETMNSSDKNSLGPFKWRNEGQQPDDLDSIISTDSERLHSIIESYVLHLQTMKAEATDPEQIKYYDECRKNLIKVKRKFGTHIMIKNIITRCAVKFRVRGFCDTLDRDGKFIGVLNGVLQLRPTIKLIQEYHEHPISRSADAVILDIETPEMKYLETEIRRLFADDEDAFEFVMLYLAASLDGTKKDPILMIWLGEGCNGKTFLLELHINTLRHVVQNGYAAKLDSTYFTKPKAHSGGTDTETSMLKCARFTYSSETAQGQPILMEKVKQLLCETMSANDKYKTQDMFEVNSLFVICSNYDPCIEGSDWGTWRRILAYTFKMTFKEDPDPLNKYEWKNDDRLLKEFPHDIKYRNAYFNILLKWYRIFREKYNGNLANVKKPTIDAETQQYRNAQDPLSLFIDDHLTPDPASTIELDAIVNRYQEWVKLRFNRTEVLRDILNKFRKSKLKKYLVKEGKIDMVLKHRFATEDDRKKSPEATQTNPSVACNANGSTYPQLTSNRDRINAIEKLIMDMGIHDDTLRRKALKLIRESTTQQQAKTQEELEAEAMRAELHPKEDEKEPETNEDLAFDEDDLGLDNDNNFDLDEAINNEDKLNLDDDNNLDLDDNIDLDENNLDLNDDDLGLD